LRCLPCLFVRGFLGSFDNGSPDILRERLVCCSRACQLASDPFSCDLFISAEAVIYIPGSFRQLQVSLLDLSDFLIIVVDRIPAEPDQLRQVSFGLFLLLDQGSEPCGRVGDLEGFLGWLGAVGDL